MIEKKTTWVNLADTVAWDEKHEDHMIDFSKSVDAVITNIRIGGWRERDTPEDANKVLLTLQLPSNSCIGGPHFSEEDPGHLFVLVGIKEAGKYKVGGKLKIAALEITGDGCDECMNFQTGHTLAASASVVGKAKGPCLLP